jgi:hypothetical protein
LFETELADLKAQMKSVVVEISKARKENGSAQYTMSEELARRERDLVSERRHPSHCKYDEYLDMVIAAKKARNLQEDEVDELKVKRTKYQEACAKMEGDIVVLEKAVERRKRV